MKELPVSLQVLYQALKNKSKLGCSIRVKLMRPAREVIRPRQSIAVRCRPPARVDIVGVKLRAVEISSGSMSGCMTDIETLKDRAMCSMVIAA